MILDPLIILAANYYTRDYKMVIFYIHHSFDLLFGIFLLKNSSFPYFFFQGSF